MVWEFWTVNHINPYPPQDPVEDWYRIAAIIFKKAPWKWKCRQKVRVPWMPWDIWLIIFESINPWHQKSHLLMMSNPFKKTENKGFELNHHKIGSCSSHSVVSCRTERVPRRQGSKAKLCIHGPNFPRPMLPVYIYIHEVFFVRKLMSANYPLS